MGGRARINLVVAAVVACGCSRSFEAHGLRAEAGVSKADAASLRDADLPDSADSLDVPDVDPRDADPRDADPRDADPRDADPPDVQPSDAGAPLLGPGAACDGDAGSLCEPNLTCVDGVCCATACGGECEQCNASGTCEPAIGRECGASLDCTDYVHGLDTTNLITHRCLASSGAVRGACVMDGTCSPATAASCAAQPPGQEITSCDQRCIFASHNCVAGEPVANVSRSSMCHLGVEAPRCDTECQNSAFGSSIQPASCTAAGACQVMQAIDCGAYRCDENTETCFTSCTTNAECVTSFASCQMDNTCG